MDPLTILNRVRDAMPDQPRVMNAALSYSMKVWSKAFVGVGDGEPSHHLDADVVAVMAAFPKTISRTQIVAITDDDDNLRRRRMLIATLMWGYGIAGLRFGKAIGYVGDLLESASLTARLADCEAALQASDVVEAFTTMRGIPGIRSTFYTKYLYFLGRSVNLDSEYPLILDSLVAKSLARLTGLHRLIGTRAYWPGEVPEFYDNYVHKMHSWATNLEVSPDVLEFYLWHGEGLSEACRQAWSERSD